MTPASRGKTRDRLALLLILLLAAFLRFWQLDILPPGLYHDEAYNGLDALSLLRGRTFPQFYEGWELYAQDAHADNPPQETRYPLFFEGNYGREPLHIYLMALSIRLFGATPFAIRAVPALAGVIAVFTTYLATDALLKNSRFTIHNSQFNIPLPPIAAFSLAVMFPAVHFSRFGLRAMVFVPVETLAVYFFWRGIGAGERGGRGAAGKVCFAAAGAMLGLGLYVYAAARLFPLLFVGFVLFWFWQDRSAMRRFWRPVAVMAGVSLVTAAPLLIFFARAPYFFIFRIAYVANKGKGAVEGKPWLTWLLNVGRVLRGLFWLGETHLRHNLPGRPYLDPFQAAAFLAGTGQSVRRWVQPRAFFLLLWLIVMLLPTILSGDAPHFGRMAGAAPAIAILIALGASWLLHHASRLTHHASRMTHDVSRITLYILFFGLSAFFTARAYFGQYAQHPQLAADFYLPDWNLGQFAAAQSPETSLFLTPTQEEMATIYFALAGDAARIRSYAGTGSLVAIGPPQTPTVYLVRSSETTRLADLQAVFPGLIIGGEQDDFIPAQVTADSPRPQPQHTATATWANQIKLMGWSSDGYEAAVADAIADVIAITLYWQAEADLERDYTAYIHLLNGQGELVAQSDRPPDGYPTSDWRPGERIVDRFVIPLPPDLPPGDYQLQTGFYDSTTLELLGTAVTLGVIQR